MFHQSGDCAFGSGTDTDVFKQLEETKEQPEGRGPGVEYLLSAGRQADDSPEVQESFWLAAVKALRLVWMKPRKLCRQ